MHFRIIIIVGLLVAAMAVPTTVGADRAPLRIEAHALAASLYASALLEGDMPSPTHILDRGTIGFTFVHSPSAARPIVIAGRILRLEGSGSTSWTLAEDIFKGAVTVDIADAYLFGSPSSHDRLDTMVHDEIARGLAVRGDIATGDAERDYAALIHEKLGISLCCITIMQSNQAGIYQLAADIKEFMEWPEDEPEPSVDILRLVTHRAFKRHPPNLQVVERGTPHWCRAKAN